MKGSSRSWEEIAEEFVAARSDIGSDVVRQWTKCLRLGSEVVDIGCGSGAPVSQTLVEAGFAVFGIDSSPTLLSMFRRRFPAQCAWSDLQTGQPSLSLGAVKYQRQLACAGMHLEDIYVNDGGNHYFDAILGPRNSK